MYFFFFFSSRRRHTRCSRDWSSDVCSSDLLLKQRERIQQQVVKIHGVRLLQRRSEGRVDLRCNALQRAVGLSAELFREEHPILRARDHGVDRPRGGGRGRESALLEQTLAERLGGVLVVDGEVWPA